MQAEMQQGAPLAGPQAPSGLLVATEEQAREVWKAQPALYRAPTTLSDGTAWLPNHSSGFTCPPWLTPSGSVINPQLAEEARAVGQISAPPSPGGSDKAARLKPEDRRRIDEVVERRAARRREEAEKAAANEARRTVQGSLFDLGP